MSKLSNAVGGLSTRIDSLIELHKKEQIKSVGLLEQQRKLENKIEVQGTEIEDLKEKIKILKLAKSLDGGGESSPEVKLKINELVREVDRCIALLNS